MLASSSSTLHAVCPMHCSNYYLYPIMHYNVMLEIGEDLGKKFITCTCPLRYCLNVQSYGQKTKNTGNWTDLDQTISNSHRYSYGQGSQKEKPS